MGRGPFGKSPDFARLVDWVEGRLDPVEAAQVERLVADDPGLARVTDWIRRFVDDSAVTVLASPPRKVHDRLVRRFEIEAARRRRPSLLQRLGMELTFDSGGMVAPAGVRGVGEVHAASRHLAYRSPTAEVAVDVYPAGEGRVRVEGQLFAATGQSTGFLVQLLRDEAECAFAAADDVGLFELGAVREDVYLLVATGDEAQLVAQLDLRRGD